MSDIPVSTAWKTAIATKLAAYPPNSLSPREVVLTINFNGREQAEIEQLIATSVKATRDQQLARGLWDKETLDARKARQEVETGEIVKAISTAVGSP